MAELIDLWLRLNLLAGISTALVLVALFVIDEVAGHG